MEEFGTIAPAPEIQEPPKRGPGRPPKDPNAPKRKYTRRNTKRDFTNDIAGILTLGNFAFLFVPDDYKGDALSPDEISALAFAINKTAQDNIPMYNALNAVFSAGGSSTLSLLAVIGAIAVKRLANHEILPTEFADRTGMLLAMMTGGNLEFTPSSPAD